MYELINEKIKALAVFESGNILPKLFRWNSRDYKIKNVSLYYQEKLGASINHFFAVQTDTGNVFKLCFNDKSLVWILTEVWRD